MIPSTLLPLLPFVAAMLPLAIAIGVVFLLRRWDARESRRMPISATVLRGAGASLRTEIELADEEGINALTGVMFLGPFALAVWALRHVDWENVAFGVFEASILTALALAYAFLIRRLYRELARKRRNKEGLIAELFTAQELDKLAASGCQVFHDIPGEKFNIDHVVVGEGAIYAVETKSRRKPAGSAGHRVGYDGQRLTFPDHVTAKPLEQAQRNAEWLATYLRGALGEPLPVVPVLALPGWYVDYGKEAGRAKVRVMPVGGRSTQFMLEPKPPIDPRLRQLACQALLMRYPKDNP